MAGKTNGAQIPLWPNIELPDDDAIYALSEGGRKSANGVRDYLATVATPLERNLVEMLYAEGVSGTSYFGMSHDARRLARKFTDRIRYMADLAESMAQASANLTPSYNQFIREPVLAARAERAGNRTMFKVK